MAGKTVHWLKIHLANAATIIGKHPETRVKEEAPNEVIGKKHQGLREFSSSPEVEVCHQGEEKHRLGSHCQRRHSMQKISKTQSTKSMMKCDVREH